jgi:hypothetical protein
MTLPESDKYVIRVFQFLHRGRTVLVKAENPDHANEQFQERFGYWPTKENQDGNT